MDRLKNGVILGSIPLLLIVFCWEFFPRAGIVEPSLLPPISEVFQSWGRLLISGRIYDDILISTKRAMIGFTAAFLIAVPLGIMIGYYNLFARLTGPLVNICRQIPAMALFPVFILFFGIGELSKYVIVFWVCIWPILFNTISGVKTVDPLLIRAARSMGADNRRIIQTVVLPGMVPSLMTGIRLGAGSSIIALVSAEMIGARSGLGFMVLNSQYNFQIAEMYVAILSIAFIGIVINELLVALEKKLSFWTGNQMNKG